MARTRTTPTTDDTETGDVAAEPVAQLADDHPHMQALEAGYVGELPEEPEPKVDGELNGPDPPTQETTDD